MKRLPPLNSDFLSCRQVLNWIAFGQATDENFMVWPDTDDCDAGLLEALQAIAEHRPFWTGGGQVPPSYSELTFRAHRLVERTNRDAESLAAVMAPKVAARKNEQEKRRIQWDNAKVALWREIQLHHVTPAPAPPSEHCRGQSSPDVMLKLELTDSIPAGWYLASEVLNAWPPPEEGRPSQAEISLQLKQDNEALKKTGRPVLKQEEVLSTWRERNGATAAQARAAIRELPGELRRERGKK